MELHIGNGIWGVIHLLLIVWAIVSIAGSKASNGAKALWIVLVILLPLLGFILWLLLGPKK
jgi:hypothetical protein